MGFWAAITIETSDVILDLNDHTIAMDKIFYYQQRWFTIISLTSQYYLPGQVYIHYIHFHWLFVDCKQLQITHRV